MTTSSVTQNVKRSTGPEQKHIFNFFYLIKECQPKVTVLLGEDVNDYYSVEQEVISTVRGEVKMKLTRSAIP